MDGTASNRNSIAETLQWITFLLVAATMGLIWIPVVFPLIGVPSEGFFWIPGVEVLWVVLTGLYIGLAFRWQAYRRQKGPSLWFALLLPFFGTLGRLSAYVLMSAPPDMGNDDYLSFFVFNLFFSYLFTGWLVIPVGVAYLWVLRWVHFRLDRWAAGAKRRDARRFAWGLAAVTVFSFVEGGRYLEDLRREGVVTWLSANGIEVSSEARLVAHQPGRVYTDYKGGETYWFFDDAQGSWPPSEGATQVSLLESADDTRGRVRRRANASVDSDAEVKQAQWRRADETVVATLVRTPKGDYLEYQVP